MTPLCPNCKHVKIIANRRGSTFYQCRAVEPHTYPRQPVLECGQFITVVTGMSGKGS